MALMMAVAPMLAAATPCMPRAAETVDSHPMESMTMDHGHSHHQAHPLQETAPVAAHVHGADADCACGHGCQMPGCSGAGVALFAAQAAPLAFSDASEFSAPSRQVRARTAHRFDLIRPPSRS
jgi:hypothetical protein